MAELNADRYTYLLRTYTYLRRRIEILISTNFGALCTPSKPSHATASVINGRAVVAVDAM